MQNMVPVASRQREPEPEADRSASPPQADRVEISAEAQRLARTEPSSEPMPQGAVPPDRVNANSAPSEAVQEQQQRVGSSDSVAQQQAMAAYSRGGFI